MKHSQQRGSLEIIEPVTLNDDQIKKLQSIKRKVADLVKKVDYYHEAAIKMAGLAELVA
jgi:hypothetical protein